MKKILFFALSLTLLILFVISLTGCHYASDIIDGVLNDGFVYIKSHDGTYYSVKEYVGFGDTEVTVPETYNGLPINEIMWEAFCYEDSIRTVILPESIVSIGDRAFFHCENLTSINMPSSLTSIGEDAFFDCFRLTNISLPDSITSIGEGAFSGCFGLTSINLPDSITSIGQSAFSACFGLTNISLPFGIKSIGDFTFSGCKGLASISIPSGITDIGYSAFSGCTSLTDITIPDSITNIADHAFDGCTTLTSITFPDSLTHIGYAAFLGCSSLTSITIPRGVTDVSDKAFWGCKSLAEINFNAIAMNDLNVGTSIFYGAVNDDGITVNIGAGVKRIPAKLFYSHSSDAKTKIISVTFADESICESIGSYAFYDCEYLTEIAFPNSVTAIGKEAFRGCTGITTVTMPDGLQKIGNLAFKGCKSLTDITIPDNVTELGDEAFSGCTGLSEINFNASELNDPATGHYIFANAGKDTYGTTVNIGASVKRIPSNLFFDDHVENRPQLLLVTFSEGSACESIGNYAFRGLEKLIAISLPDGMTDIGYSAFADCTSLKSITMSDSVTGIGYAAFTNCTSLTGITIPDSVTDIGDKAFWGCTSLTEINFNAIAMNDLSKNSLVFHDAGIAGSGIDVTIGAKVKRIPANLFYGYSPNVQSKIKSVVFADESACESIGNDAFGYCAILTNIIIPTTVTSIGNYAFAGCKALTSINYRGTEAEWNAVIKGEGWDSSTGSYKMTYNYGGE